MSESEAVSASWSDLSDAERVERLQDENAGLIEEVEELRRAAREVLDAPSGSHEERAARDRLRGLLALTVSVREQAGPPGDWTAAPAEGDAA